MRFLKILIASGLLAGAGLSMSGCATTEQNGVIIEQRRWWHIFSEAEPPRDGAGEEPTLPS